MKITFTLFALLVSIAGVGRASSLTSDPWADTVESYTPGANPDSVFGSNPPLFFERSLSALGAPTRNSVAFGGFAVTPFGQAADPAEVVSIGEGGSLTVSFDVPVTNDPLNPFGIDLLIFGNTFLNGDFSTDPLEATGAFASEGGVVEVSADGVNYVLVSGVEADGLYPTVGYQDVAANFTDVVGNAPTDFTRPVDPSITTGDFAGLTTTEIVALYDGSGGGVGIDLQPLGLDAISFVRISNPIGSGVTPEIDAFADVRGVPEPAAVLLVALAVVPSATRRR